MGPSLRPVQASRREPSPRPPHRRQVDAQRNWLPQIGWAGDRAAGNERVEERDAEPPRQMIVAGARRSQGWGGAAHRLGIWRSWLMAGQRRERLDELGDGRVPQLVDTRP